MTCIFFQRFTLFGLFLLCGEVAGGRPPTASAVRSVEATPVRPSERFIPTCSPETFLTSYPERVGVSYGFNAIYGMGRGQNGDTSRRLKITRPGF